MDLMTALDTIGIIVFAASGAINAIQKKMDIFGIFTLATVTAIGGGVIRDVVINIDLQKATVFALYCRNRIADYFHEGQV